MEVAIQPEAYTLVSKIIIEVSVPSQESEQSCM